MSARDPWDRRVLLHNGAQTGARSVLLLYPDAGLVVAVLSNLTNIPRFIEGTVMGIGEPFLQSSKPAEPAKVLRRWPGPARTGSDPVLKARRAQGVRLEV